jgi:prepilin-type N-terminal cleavage/methylation domain-containing protein
MHRRRSALTLVELLVVIAIIGVVIALLLPNVRTGRGAARRNHCQNNLKSIALALSAYEEEHGTLPPAYTVDEQGNQLHSWRTLILPYMEQAALYKTIDLAKPWDDPVNDKARDTIVEAYQCPSSPKLNEVTNYLAVVGPDCAFTGSEPRKISDAKDGPENTIMLIEVSPEHAVPWMSPEDIDPNGILSMIPDDEMNHPGVILATYLDCSTRSIDQGIDPDILRALLTIAGGEKLDE